MSGKQLVLTGFLLFVMAIALTAALGGLRHSFVEMFGLESAKASSAVRGSDE